MKGRNGGLFYVFHTHNAVDKVAPRRTAIIKMKFIKDKKSGVDKLAVQAATFDYLHEE